MCDLLDGRAQDGSQVHELWQASSAHAYLFLLQFYVRHTLPPILVVVRPRANAQVMHAFHHTPLCSPSSTVNVLLQRLKARFPAARGSSGCQLFVSIADSTSRQSQKDRSRSNVHL